VINIGPARPEVASDNPKGRATVMNALIVYAHPWEGSYNHAVLEAVQRGLAAGGTGFETIDLNIEGFNPVLTQKDLAQYSKGGTTDPKVAEYQGKINACDYLFVIFPVWWGSMPAILKGFFDKVLLKGWAYDAAPMGMLKPLIHNVKRAVVISTMNAPRFYYNVFMGQQIKYGLINGMLKTCGISPTKWFSLSRVVYVSRKKRQRWLDAIEAYARKLG
jgi:NAD(P)H dehydrogenase (quinone)